MTHINFMISIIAILFFGTCFCGQLCLSQTNTLQPPAVQKTIPQFADMRKNANSFAQYQINNLKDGGAILVRLSTRQKTINAMLKQGLNERAAAFALETEQKNLQIAAQIKNHIDFCPVYFFYSDDTEQLLLGKRTGFLRNALLELDTNLIVPDFYVVLERGPVYAKDASYFDKPDQAVTGEFNLPNTTAKPYTQHVLIRDALVFKDASLVQMAPPFPYYRTTGFTKKALAQKIKKLNKALHNFYHTNNKM
ncbi:MAG: hypothetical protein OT643_13590 [Bacteroidetes bacterium]|jgi:hypothetical protein|nr:hypothetical protein [Bacteroidota bacterium]